MKPKIGPKRPLFLRHGGLQPTPSRDGDGQGWRHWPLRHLTDFVQGWRNKLYDLCYHVNPTKIEKVANLNYRYLNQISKKTTKNYILILK